MFMHYFTTGIIIVYCIALVFNTIDKIGNSVKILIIDGYVK